MLDEMLIFLRRRRYRSTPESRFIFGVLCFIAGLIIFFSVSFSKMKINRETTKCTVRINAKCVDFHEKLIRPKSRKHRVDVHVFYPMLDYRYNGIDYSYMPAPQIYHRPIRGMEMKIRVNPDNPRSFIYEPVPGQQVSTGKIRYYGLLIAMFGLLNMIINFNKVNFIN